MSVTPYKEYPIRATHLGSEPLTPAVPVLWLREHTKPQDRIVLGIESHTRVLVIGTPEQIEKLTALLNGPAANGSAKSVGDSIPDGPSVE